MATEKEFTVTPEQREELRAKWVEALESGEYDQCGGSLHRGDRFCCLGVACEIFEKQFPGVLEIEKVADEEVSYDFETNTLPRVVRVAFGFQDKAGQMKLPDENGVPELSSLTELNDKDTPFSEIAAIIKSKPDGLFTD